MTHDLTRGFNQRIGMFLRDIRIDRGLQWIHGFLIKY